MAEFGWSKMMHGNENNVHELNHVCKRPFASTQIACRICDQVFLSNRSLINHIYTHTAEYESVVASRRRQEQAQRDFFAKKRNPFLHGALADRLPVPPSWLSLSMGALGSQLPPDYKSRQVQVEMQWRMAAAEPARDFTKPFLNQSHHNTIPANHLAAREDGNIFDSEMLDLTLKL